MIDLESLDFAKQGGLMPAIVQDARSHRVLMLGYMDRAALEATLAQGRVTFFSRSKGRLWMKGESSGDVLELVAIETDCDGDALLVQAIPHGPTCHLKRTSCFAQAPGSVLGELEAIVAQRARERPQGSYTATLFEAGPKRIAQKIGEEGVETALALLAETDEALLGEVADLFFHTLVGLQARGLSLAEVGRVLEKRRLAKQRVSD